MKFTADTASNRIERLQSFDIHRETWLVPDLAGKTSLQNRLLERCKVLPEDAVLRANEFWRKILKNTCPEVEIVSRDLIETQLREWLREQRGSLAAFAGTPRNLVAYIETFLPVFKTSQNLHLMVDWLNSNIGPRLRWGPWFELAYEAWEHFKKQKCLPMSWVAGFLSSDDIEIHWPRRLVVNLDGDLNGIESELFEKISSVQDVEIFHPETLWIERYETTLWPYKKWLASESPSEGEDFSVEKRVEIKRMSTQLAEVKDAVQFVRRLLDGGAQPGDLGILATDIEAYWPVLEAYLRQEGIPCRKPVTMNAHGLPGIAYWLGKLRVELAGTSKSDIEISTYTEESPQLKYDEFVRLYARIYDVKDLDRSPEIRKRYEMRIKPNQRLRRDEFWAWALKFWMDTETRGLERISSELLYECPDTTSMEAGSWLQYIERLAARAEFAVREQDETGIFIGKSETSSAMRIKHVAVLGLSDAGVKEAQELALTHQDTMKLWNDLGFAISSPDRRKREYYVEKRSRDTEGEVMMSFATATLTGTAAAPSQLWLEFAHKKGLDFEAVAVPAPTRWDELQASVELRPENGTLISHIDRDMGIQPKEYFKPATDVSYSASSIERYLECPFKFASEKIFRLKDSPLVDLDIDHMSRGNLIHKVLEYIIREPLNLDLSAEDIEGLIEKAREATEIIPGDPRLWSAEKAELSRQVQKVIAFEREWRQRFPSTKTVGNEVEFDSEVEWGGERFQLRGKIDRIDSNGGNQYVLIDYKSTGTKLTYHGSWIKNHQLQLMIYYLAVKEGLTELPPGQVVGAFYFVISELERKKGFCLKGKDHALSDFSRYNGIEDDELLELESQIKEIIGSVIRDVRAGRLIPLPKDLKDCERCHWRTVCRAHHLN